jgi:hypothetical protein
MNKEVEIIINEEKLSHLIKSNISCHANKLLNQELIEALTHQIIESIDYFLNKPD